MKYNLSKTLILCISSLFIVVAASLYSPSPAEATVIELEGWAWSSNIGWISFNCDNGEINYCNTWNAKVLLDSTTGEITGQALANPSEPSTNNIGFINMAPPTIEDAPQHPNNPKVTSRLDLQDLVLEGWARFCISESSGCMGTYSTPVTNWDGWLSLKGSNYSITVDPVSGNLSGYAWGGYTVGWVDFSGVKLAQPLYAQIIIDAVPEYTNYQLNYNTTIYWSDPYVSWYECEAATEPDPTGSQWVGNVQPPVAGEAPQEMLTYVPSPETVFKIRCKYEPNGDWSEWFSTTVYRSDIWLNVDACYDSNQGLGIQYGSYNPSLSFASCTASNSENLPEFTGSVPVPPPPNDYNTITITGIGQDAISTGIDFELVCIDENGVSHPTGAPLTDNVASMCTVNYPPNSANVIFDPQVCLDPQYWDDNIGFPPLGAPITTVIQNNSTSDIVACVGYSDPPTSNINGFLFPPIESGETQILNDAIIIKEYGQEFGLEVCESPEGSITDIEPAIFNGGICGVSPTPDLKGVYNGNAYDDIDENNAVPAGSTIDLSWTISNWLGAECLISSIIGDNNLDDRTLQASEIPSGYQANVQVNGTSFFSLYCYIPAFPEKNSQDILRVCVEGSTCPADLPDSSIPFFEEI